MYRMNFSLICCCLFAAALRVAANDGNSTDQSATENKPGASLKLLGECPETPKQTLDALEDHRWQLSRLRDILGRGTDTILHFTGSDQLKLERIERTNLSANQPKRPDGKDFNERSTHSDCAINGPILSTGNMEQTFALVPGKELVLNAVVPLGNKKWYYASRTVYGDNAKSAFHETEMRFDFADDPLTTDDGKAVLHLRSNNGTQDATREINVRFTLESKPKEDRRIRVVADDEKKTAWARLVFPTGGGYALIVDQPNRNSEVLHAIP